MSSLVAVLAHYGCHEPNPTRATGKILCPVHDERRPSCSYNLELGVLNCFSCGFQGDAVTLVMAKEGIGAKAALARCAEIAGGGDGVVRKANDRPASQISGRPSYAPKYRRGIPARRRRYFD